MKCDLVSFPGSHVVARSGGQAQGQDKSSRDSLGSRE